MELLTPGAIIRGATKRDLCGLFSPSPRDKTGHQSFRSRPRNRCYCIKGKIGDATVQKAALETSVNTKEKYSGREK